MPEIVFDNFAHLEPARALAQIEATLDATIFDSFSHLEPARARQQLEAFLGTEIFTPFSNDWSRFLVDAKAGIEAFDAGSEPVEGDATIEITGDAIAGETLTAVFGDDDTDGEHSGGTDTQWFADDVALEGETSETLFLRPEHIDTRISARIDYSIGEDEAAVAKFVVSVQTDSVIDNDHGIDDDAAVTFIDEFDVETGSVPTDNSGTWKVVFAETASSTGSATFQPEDEPGNLEKELTNAPPLDQVTVRLVDMAMFDTTKGLIFEMKGKWNKSVSAGNTGWYFGPDASHRFNVNGANHLLYIGIGGNNDSASFPDITISEDVEYTYTIDMRDPDDLKFYLDRVRIRAISNAENGKVRFDTVQNPTTGLTSWIISGNSSPAGNKSMSAYSDYFKMTQHDA